MKLGAACIATKNSRISESPRNCTNEDKRRFYRGEGDICSSDIFKKDRRSSDAGLSTAARIVERITQL